MSPLIVSIGEEMIWLIGGPYQQVSETDINDLKSIIDTIELIN